MHIDGSRRGISKLDLGAVFASPEEKAALTAVRSLDLSHNELSDLRSLRPLTALAILEASHNRIAAISGLPESLTKLVLQDNSLTSLDSLGHCPSLTILDVSANQLTCMPHALHAPELTALLCSSNRISSLERVDRFPKLRKLMVSENPIVETLALSPLSGVPQLRSLTLKGCPVLETHGAKSTEAIVRRLLPHLVDYNGMPLTVVSRPSTTANSPSSSSSAAVDHRAELNASSVSTKSSVGSARRSMSAGGGRDGDTSRGDRGRTATVAAVSDHQELIMAQRLLLQERRDNAALKKQLAAADKQLAEARRLLSEELASVRVVKEQNAKLANECDLLRNRCEKLNRDLKYATQKSRGDEERRISELEALRIEHEANLARIRTQFQAHMVEVRRQSLSEAHARIAALEADNRRLSGIVAQYSNVAHLAESHTADHQGASHQRPTPTSSVRPRSSIHGSSKAHPAAQGSQLNDSSIVTTTSSAAGDATTSPQRAMADVDDDSPPSHNHRRSKSQDGARLADQLKSWLLAEVAANSKGVPAGSA